MLAGSDQGRTAYTARLHRQAEALGIADRLRCVGDWIDMPAALLLADIVVHASTEPEAFGRVVIEAQAMGRPVIASDLGGPVETVEHGVTGWRVLPANPQALAGAIRASAGDGPTIGPQSAPAPARRCCPAAHPRNARRDSWRCIGKYSVVRRDRRRDPTSAPQQSGLRMPPRDAIDTASALQEPTAHAPITLPDGSVRRFDAPITGAALAEVIGPGLARAALAMKLDGRLGRSCYQHRSRRRGGIRHPPRPGGAGADPARRRPCAGGGGAMSCYPGTRSPSGRR